ncbi:MAG: DNA repair protein RecO [Chloroflexi bacterium]|nr:MAG: DNA repair protein RecO [Chloroflexota bacterium]
MAERSHTYRTQAVILRRRDYSEADRILTVYTPRLGKVELIAKGVRKTTSRKAGHLELFSHASLLVAQARTWDIVTEATTMESFLHLRGDLDCIGWAGYVCELVDAFGSADDENEQLWEMLLFALRVLDSGEVGIDLFLRWFELHLLSLVGFQPEFFHCLACGDELQAVTNYLGLAAGGVFCPRCGEAAGGTEPIEAGLLKILRHIQRSSWTEVRAVQLRPQTLQSVENILYRYLLLVLERQLRSVDFVRRLRAVRNQP